MTADRPRLLFATRSLAIPQVSGSPIRTNRLVNGLAETFDITFVAHETTGSAQRELEADLPGVRVITLPEPRMNKRVSQLLSVPRRRSWDSGRFRTRQWRTVLRQAAAGWPGGVVHFDDPGVALNGPLPGLVNAFAPHNVEHRIVASTAESSSGVRAAFARLDARRLGAEEHRLWRESDLCVAVSEVDGEAMRAAGARDVVVIPNGTDPRTPFPPPRRAAGEPFRVLFVGLGSYWPNTHGIEWFVREVLPRLRERTDVRFDVVGEPPPDPVHAEGVTYHGRVPELDPFYEQAHAVAVPLFIGSGTRLKVVEAMSFGRPVVATTIGAEGVPVRPGEHFFRHDEPEGFAAALGDVADRLAADPDSIATMLGEAREAVTPLFWPAIAGRLAGIYQERWSALRAPTA